jgi:hypothetical protein
MFGYIPPEMMEAQQEEPPKPSGLIFACIERSRGTTFCNRCPSDKEFVFTSYRHAVTHYNPRTPKAATPRLKACIACYDAAKEHIAKEDESRLA